ncbi:MAG TPA: hypothetical protein VN442_05440 [Bryobacteraceae bacterium]|nr:hypothetical protein [Bryobacteraceae bacterium]
MIDTLRAIVRGTLERLAHMAETQLPPLIVAAAIMLSAFLLASVVRLLILRVFHGIALDRFLRRSGVSSLVDHSGTLRASGVVAQSAYWGILIIGFLAALQAFGTEFTARIAEGAVLLFPRLLAGAAVVLGGIWLAQYLGRSALVWAVNEDWPWARLFAAAVRSMVVFAAVVVAADILNFARGVFLIAFVLVLGGAVLAASLALGLGARDAVRRRIEESTSGLPEPEPRERSLWHHL